MEQEQEQQEINKYISQLDDIQKQAFEIAKEHLGTSFNIAKSNGFKEWKKNNVS